MIFSYPSALMKDLSGADHDVDEDKLFLSFSMRV